MNPRLPATAPRWYVALPVALLVLHGCGAGTVSTSDEDGVRFEVDASGAYPVAVNRGDAPRWMLEPILEVGSTGGAGEAAPDEFGRLTSVALAPDGTVWTSDALASAIKVFSRDGSFVRQIGRNGEGPGEFDRLYSVAFVGDTALALDFGNGRVGELSLDGEWLGQRPAAGGLSGSPARLRLFVLDSTRVSQWSFDSSSDDFRRVWIHHTPGGVTGTRAQVEFEAPESFSMTCESPQMIRFFNSPFAPSFQQAPATDSTIWTAWTAAYRIVELDAAEDTVRAIEVADWSPVPIDDDAWEVGSADYREARDAGELAGASCDPRTLPRAEFKTAFRSILQSTTRELWVEVEEVEGTRWDIFAPSGRRIGTVPGFDYDDRVAPHIRGREIAWVEQDDLGIQRVRVARVTEID